MKGFLRLSAAALLAAAAVEASAQQVGYSAVSAPEEEGAGFAKISENRSPAFLAAHGLSAMPSPAWDLSVG